MVFLAFEKGLSFDPISQALQRAKGRVGEYKGFQREENSVTFQHLMKMREFDHCQLKCSIKVLGEVQLKEKVLEARVVGGKYGPC